MTELETERLNFRQWQLDDFATFHRFFSDDANAQFVGGKKTAEEAWRLMATYVGHYELNGFGYLAVEEKQSQTLIGTVGLWKSEPWPEVELGYWLVPDMQGKGYAMEAATVVIDYAFNKLGLETVVSYIDEKNIPSIRLAERLGGYRDGVIELLQFGRHEVYRYDYHKYANATAG